MFTKFAFLNFSLNPPEHVKNDEQKEELHFMHEQTTEADFGWDTSFNRQEDIRTRQIKIQGQNICGKEKLH